MNASKMEDDDGTVLNVAEEMDVTLYHGGKWKQILAPFGEHVLVSGETKFLKVDLHDKQQRRFFGSLYCQNKKTEGDNPCSQFITTVKALRELAFEDEVVRLYKTSVDNTADNQSIIDSLHAKYRNARNATFARIPLMIKLGLVDTHLTVTLPATKEAPEYAFKVMSAQTSTAALYIELTADNLEYLSRVMHLGTPPTEADTPTKAKPEKGMSSYPETPAVRIYTQARGIYAVATRYENKGSDRICVKRLIDKVEGLDNETRKKQVCIQVQRTFEIKLNEAQSEPMSQAAASPAEAPAPLEVSVDASRPESNTDDAIEQTEVMRSSAVEEPKGEAIKESKKNALFRLLCVRPPS